MAPKPARQRLPQTLAETREASLSHNQAARLLTGLWLLLLAVLTGLSKTSRQLQGSEDYAQFVLSVWATTPFYPGSNRAGALLPLLTSGLNDVDMVRVLQMILRAFFAYFALYSAARLFARSRASATDVAIVAGIAALLIHAQLTSSGFYVVFASNHTYMVAAAVLLQAIRVLRPDAQRLSVGWWRAALGTVGMAIAYWVNLSLYTMTALCVATLALSNTLRSAGRDFRARKRVLPGLRAGLVASRFPILVFVLSTVAFLAADAAGRLYALAYPELTRSFATAGYAGVNLSISSIPLAIRGLAREAGGVLLLGEVLACLALASIRCGIFRIRLPRAFDPLTSPAVEVALLAAAVGHLLLVSQTAHAQTNDLNYRYVLISALAIPFLCASYVFGVWRWSLANVGASTKLWSHRLAAAVCVPGLVAFCIAYRHETPLQLPSAAIVHERIEAAAHMAVAGNYAAVLGSYWDVWPVTFRAAALRSGRTGGRRLYPTSFRSELLSGSLHDSVRRDVLSNGVARYLCLVPGSYGTDVAGLDCQGMLRWNETWGSLPRIGGPQSVTPLGILDLQEVTVAPTLWPLERTISFASGGEGYAYQFAGWSAPETFGSWTSALRADLIFSLDSMPTQTLDLHLTVVTDVGKFAVPPRTGAVSVSVNDVHVGAWTFNPDSGRHVIAVPANILRRHANVLTFDIVSPHFLSDFGQRSTDGRNLGFALSSARWTASSAL
jgi:hypothetical protein